MSKSPTKWAQLTTIFQSPAYKEMLYPFDNDGNANLNENFIYFKENMAINIFDNRVEINFKAIYVNLVEVHRVSASVGGCGTSLKKIAEYALGTFLYNSGKLRGTMLFKL